MSTRRLFAYMWSGRKVGGCYLGKGSARTACDMYVKTPTPGAGGYNGWPRTTADIGTGCVKAPDFPKAVSTCYYASPSYGFAPAVYNTFCTSSGMANAVAQMKHAVENDKCGLCEREAQPERVVASSVRK